MQTDVKQPPLPGRQSWVYFVAGGSGAAFATTVTFPLDVVKTRAQSDLFHSQISTTVRQRNTGLVRQGTVEILASIYKREGWRTLFKGLGPNLCSFVPETAIGFYAYGNSKRFLANHFNHGEESAAIHLSAAAFSGIATETCTNPLWVIKTRLQLDKDRSVLQLNGTTRMYKSSWDCAAKIMHSEGLRGLYRGLALSYLGVTEFALQWVLYEHIKATLGIGRESKESIGREYARHDVSFDWIGELGAGGASKLIAAAIAYPHEVIRTRLRQRPLGSDIRKYTGNIQCFKLIWKQEGLVGLYGGLCPHLLRVVPGAAILFGTYETVIRLFEEY